MAGDGTSGSEGACFDFDDMKALRDEYEERVRKAERERDAAVDVLRRDAESRLASLQREHEARIASEAAARQELIEDLTVELAAAREEGELRARAADEERTRMEAMLRKTLADVGRIESELARVREVLTAVLAPPAPMAASASPATPSGAPPPTGAGRVPPPVPSDASTVAAVWGTKRKKIRLR